MNNKINQNELKRWYPLIPHPEQLKISNLIEDGVRFVVVPAGRRSGKTERIKRLVARLAMANSQKLYAMCAPTYNQAKKIFWEDMKALTFSSCHPKKPSESALIIFMPNGTKIHIIGLDQPQRIEGIPWDGMAIDEIADVKPDSVSVNIMPALNTVNPLNPFYRPWAIFTGVPNGMNHYYDMYQYAIHSGDQNWGFAHWKSSDILPKDVIEAEKRRMSPKEFAQEYCASFETPGDRIYEDYDENNTNDSVIQEGEALHWTHDQNFTPLSSCVAVIRKDSIHIVDEIVLSHAVSRQSAIEFCDKFRDHPRKVVYVYGDASGRKGEKHGHASDYTEIEHVLRANGWAYERRVKPANPPIRDRQNAVRSKICNAEMKRSLFVNPNKAPWCHKGLMTLQRKQGSSFMEDETNKYQHITTAIGYMIHYLYRTDFRYSDANKTEGI